MSQRHPLRETPIPPYPDEPHPDNEHTWKCFWVRKFFRPEQTLTPSDLQFVHTCWVETKARRCPKIVKNKC